MIDSVWTYWTDGGWLLLPIAVVAYAILAYLLRLRFWLQDSIAAAQATEAQLDAYLSGKADRGALLDQLAASPQWIARQVADVFGSSTHAEDARRRFENVTAWQRSMTQRDLFILKALTAAAPLLGLLGTVTGMVDTFIAVARHGAEGAALVARGISSALITTQFGLVAALPGVFGLLHLGRLRTRLQSATNAIGTMLYVSYGNKRGAHA